jgi:hypothetical protein
MRTKKPSNIRIYYIALALAGLLTLYLWPSLVVAMPLTAKHHLERPWRTAADIGRFQYETTVLQTTRPTARLENAGRHSTIEPLMVQGMVDRPNKAMQIRLWSPGVGKNGIELKVESGQAFGHTDPTRADSDGDFISDKTEVTGLSQGGHTWYLAPSD